MPLLLQVAFAMTLGGTVAGESGVQVFSRLAPDGPKVGGLLVGIAGLLNFALSYLAMKSGMLTGIAFATVIAQSVLTIYLTRRTAGAMGLNWLPWVGASWLYP